MGLTLSRSGFLLTLAMSLGAVPTSGDARMQHALPGVELPARIESMIAGEAWQESWVGIVVMRPDGTVLYERMADVRMVPASNQKVLSAVFALDTFGPDYRPETKFWKEGDDIWVDAVGDPSLTSVQFAELRARFKPSPKSRVFVRSAFGDGYGPGWEYDDLPFRYAPRVTAFSADRAQFEVTHANGIVKAPAWAGVQVRHEPGLADATATFDREKRVVTVLGRLKADTPLVARFAQPDPTMSAALMLGGKLIRTDKVPDRAPDYIHKGDDMRTWVKNCLEPSDNLLAEMLLISAASKRTPLGTAPYAKAQAELTKFMTETVGVKKGAVRPDDGSGLSRHNLVSPRALAQVLRHAYSSPYRDVFVDGLPQSGEGTLRTRLKGMAVSAKTGSLDVVSALSGYVHGKDDESLIFSIMLNHHVVSTAQARELQDTIVGELLAWLDSERFYEREYVWCGSVEKDVSDPRTFAFADHRLR